MLNDFQNISRFRFNFGQRLNIIQTTEILDIFSEQHQLLRSTGRIHIIFYVSKIRINWALAWHGTHRYFFRLLLFWYRFWKHDYLKWWHSLYNTKNVFSVWPLSRHTERQMDIVKRYNASPAKINLIMDILISVGCRGIRF